jgi:hypothetical protein
MEAFYVTVCMTFAGYIAKRNNKLGWVNVNKIDIERGRIQFWELREDKAIFHSIRTAKGGQ